MTNQEILAYIRALSRGDVLDPPAEIGEILLRHRCDHLLKKLKKHPSQQEMQLACVVQSVSVKERYRACLPLFPQTEIPYAVIKGAALSQRLYNDPLVRTSGDIDILIHRRDADRLKQLLTENGFVQGRVTDDGIQPFSRREILFQTAMSHQTAPYIKATGNKLCPFVNLDVNMDLLWGECDENADMELVLSHTEETSLFGIPFQRLTREMEFISLCLHHYKDMNSLYLLSSGSLRLGLFCEICDYLQNVRPNVERLCSLCKQLRVGKYVYACIAQTQEIFDDPTPTLYLNALASQRDDRLLDCFGLNDKERKSWDLSLVDRLFHPNLPEYLQARLTDEEKEKVRINREWM